jgi:hypothetical protein
VGRASVPHPLIEEKELWRSAFTPLSGDNASTARPAASYRQRHGGRLVDRFTLIFTLQPQDPVARSADSSLPDSATSCFAATRESTEMPSSDAAPRRRSCRPLPFGFLYPTAITRLSGVAASRSAARVFPLAGSKWNQRQRWAPKQRRSRATVLAGPSKARGRNGTRISRVGIADPAGRRRP